MIGLCSALVPREGLGTVPAVTYEPIATIIIHDIADVAETVIMQLPTSKHRGK